MNQLETRSLTISLLQSTANGAPAGPDHSRCADPVLTSVRPVGERGIPARFELALNRLASRAEPIVRGEAPRLARLMKGRAGTRHDLKRRRGWPVMAGFVSATATSTTLAASAQSSRLDLTRP